MLVAKVCEIMENDIHQALPRVLGAEMQGGKGRGGNSSKQALSAGK